MSGTQKTGGGKGEEKRKTILTEKALANKIESIEKERKRKVDEIKRLISSTRELTKDEKNVSLVKSQVDVIVQLLDNATALHDSLLLLIPSDEQKVQNEWFLKISKYKEGFLQDVEAWFKATSGRPGKAPSETQVTGRLQQEEASEKEIPVEDGKEHQFPQNPNTQIHHLEETASLQQNQQNDGHNEMPQFHQHSQNDYQDTVAPTDSVSNQGSKSSGSRSKVSSTASACLRAEAEMAALLARQRWLKEKHALEEQEEQIRKQKEQLQLEAEIAASMAKVNVLKTSGSSVHRRVSRKKDGMDSYFKGGFNVHAETFVPNKDGQNGGMQPVTGNVNLPVGGARTKTPVRDSTNYLQQRAPKLPNPQTTTTAGSALPVSQHNDTHGHFSHKNSSEHNIMSILEKQNEMTSILLYQQTLASLPKRDIQVFDGNPLQYHAFMQAFEHTIETKTNNPADCLHYLEQYTSGQPQQLVRSCQHITDGTGYATAKAQLHEHFGNEHHIASAYMNKIFAWPQIKSEDAKALQAYSLFLRGCCTAMKDVYDLCDLNTPANMLIVIKKLPYKLRDKWRTKACDIQERLGKRPMFADIAAFVERQVKIVVDPIYGDIQDVPTIGANKDSGKAKPMHRPKARGSSFATAVTALEKTSHSEKGKIKDGAEKICLYCKKGSHMLESCTLLERKAHGEKMEFLKTNGVCFGCLCTGHISKECRKRLSCKICGSRHPSMLHIYQRENEAEKEKNKSVSAVDGALVKVNTGGLTGAGDQDCKLAIVPVKVKSTKGQKVVETYAFLDLGSSASFCTVGLMEKLDLSGRKTKILLRTMGQEKVVESHIASALEVAGLDSDVYCELPKIFTQQEMPVKRSNIPRQRDLKRWPHLKHVYLPEIDADVEILIGTNVPRALEPLEVIRSVDGGPYAVKTMLGWTVNGPLGDCSDNHVYQYGISVNRISAVTLDELWTQQFKTDFPESSQDEQPGLSREDRRFLEMADKTVKLVDGHYSVALPLRDRKFSMPNNRKIAEQRTFNLKRRFSRDKSFHQDYTAFMNDLISNGYAERVPHSDLERSDGKVWYIPHHGVYHPQKKTIRVVFDCGASFKDASLNAHLLQGPDLTSTLVGVLTRFRKEPIVLMSDIKAMFHQVRVPEEDADLLRFLWWPNGDLNEDMAEYRVVVHLFGATSSPSCVNFALRKCAEDNKELFSQQVFETIMHSFYVDDLLTSVASEQEAISLCDDLRTICARGGFHLTKWISNSRGVLASIPEKERAKEVKDLDLDQDVLPVERALGVRWCVQSDTFKFNITFQDRPLTRRGILSTVGSFYDPLGILAPVIFTAKRILQDLCRKGLGWDDPIPASASEEWTNWMKNLQLLEDFHIRRCLKPPNFGEATVAQLHHFADASEEGYGTVTYLMLTNQQGQVHSAFIMGKSRVAPLKPVTIPRMELTAAVMAARMDWLWRRELRLQLQDSVFWSDSTTVLKYLKNETSRFRVFVANRISEILKMSNPSQWRYVPTADNPADLASRGLRTELFLKSEAWISGPSFLIQPEEAWPVNPESLGELPSGDPEVKVSGAVVSMEQEENDAVTRLINRSSSWTRLTRVMAWILRLKTSLQNIRKKREVAAHLAQSSSNLMQTDALNKEMQDEKSCHGCLSVAEIREAEVEIIKFCQRSGFPEEFSCLQRGECVKSNSHIYKLSPILEEGVLRVGGRLSKAAMPEESKHPAIIGKDFHISDLIVRQIHLEVGHGGRNHVLSRLRQRYWIPSASVVIRKVLAKCVICRRLHGAAGQQQMADLPIDRVSADEPPFSYVGVDCFGPFDIMRGRSLVKRYGVIFTCLTIRAVHIEVASSLDTDSFINALRRFIARRGQIKELRSDNGTNFIGAERELKRAIEAWNLEKIHDTLSVKGIKWTFNPPTASHHGGAWERLIRSIRKILNSTLRTQNLDEEGLQTVLCEAESILNSRPLTKESTDPNDLEALTPNHLLLLKSKPSLPPGLFHREDSYARRRWKQVQYISDLFWKRWIKEYLPQLQERQKWAKVKRNFVPGDIVIIVDDSAPRNSWIVGRITEAVPDRKGLVRQVRIKTRTSTLCRPVTKICLLQESAQL